MEGETKMVKLSLNAIANANEIESLCKMKSIKDPEAEADEYVNRLESYAERAYNDQREW